MLRLLLVVLAISAAALGCGSPDVVASSRARTTVRDTVGDTVVVRNSGPGAWGDSLYLVEEVRIGDAAGSDEYGLAFVVAIAVDAHGTITVSDLQMRSVRQYDARGTFLRQIGREGSGPGEYRSAEALAHLPDGRLIVRDAGNQRINVYTADGRFLDALRLPSTLSGLVNSLLVDSAARINAVAITGRDPVRTGWLRMDDTGRILDTLRLPEWTTQVSNPAPYEAEEGWRLHPSGAVVGGVNDRYAVHLLRTDGTVLRIERTDVAAVAVPDAERAELEARRQDERRRSRERHLARPFRPIPAAKPAYWYVEAAADGRIWVRPHLPSAEREVVAADADSVPISERPPRWYEPTAWDVFEPDGAYLGRLRLPPRTRVLLMRGDHVWGTLRDSLDVPYVLRWRIRRPVMEP